METYLNLLSEFISFKSISTDVAFKEDINKTVAWLESLLSENSFKLNTVKGFGNPIVVASYEVDPSLQTCLIYGHYDVQPAKKEDGWNSEPFQVEEREGRLYARGVVDTKDRF